MELNRVELLVHDDKALKKFRRTYGIPADVRIERPGPNDVPHVVADNPNRIPIRSWLIYQAGL